jgi:protoporphyrinogen oxidase
MNQRVVIIGAGFCGLNCALELSRKGGYDITVLEQSPAVGGLGGGVRTKWGVFDFGSHRLHPGMLETARNALEQLPVRLDKKKRHGMLRFSGSYTSYPPSLLGLAWCMGAVKMSQACLSYITQRVNSGYDNEQTYESTMRRKVGGAFFETFFAPYARKIWGMDPSHISLTAAGRWLGRSVDNRNISYCQSGASHEKREYLYPCSGFLTLAEALADAVVSNGVRIRTSCNVQTIHSVNGRTCGCNLRDGNGDQYVDADWVVNTSPIDEQLRMMRPEICDAHEISHKITWRSLRLLYVITRKPVDPDGPESLYFPELAYPFGRISFPSRFSQGTGSGECESLCIEIICSRGDQVWLADDRTLLLMVLESTRRAGILDAPDIEDIFSIRFPRIYPVYSIDWKKTLHSAAHRLSDFSNHLPAGKMGLFLHCNIDHAMHTGELAARHILHGAQQHEWLPVMEGFHDICVRN